MTPLFGSKSVLGIDIGTSSIKLVQLKKSREKPKLETYGELQTYGYFERPNDAIQTSSLKMMEEQTASMISDLIKQSGATAKNTVMSLPLFSSFVSTLEMPLLPENEYKEAIPYEAKRIIPTPISELEFSWDIIRQISPEPGKPASKVEILLVAVSKETVNRYLKIVQLSKLNIVSLELESFCLAKSLIEDIKSAVLILDIGTRVTNISIVAEGKVRIVHNFDTGSGELTQAIANSLNINYLRAEEIKKREGIKAGADRQIAELIFPFVDLIVNETERAANSFYQKYSLKIGKVILTGGAALMPGLLDYIAQKLGTEAVLGNPFSKISYPSSIEPLIRELSSVFAVAIGSAIKGLELK